MEIVRKLILLAILYLVYVPVFSQDQIKVDSLLSLLPADTDSLSAIIYRDIGLMYQYVDNEQSEMYAKKAYEFANRSEIPSLIHLAVVNLGDHYGAAGDEENTAIWYEAALADLDEQADGPEIAAILNSWGILFCTKGYYDKGMLKFQEALSVVNVKWPDTAEKGESLLLLGMIHGSLKNYETSDDYLERAILFFQEEEDFPLLNETIMMLGVNQLENYQFHRAKENFLEVLAYYESVKDQFNTAKCCSNLGAAFLHLDSLDKAEFYFNKGLDIAQEIKREHLQLMLYQRLGQVNFLKEKYIESVHFLQQSVPLSIALEDIRAQAKDHDYLAYSYEALGEYDLAYSHLREHIVLQDSILSQDKITQMNELEQKYETQRKEQEIILLEERAKRDRLEKRGLVSGLLGALGLLGSLIYAMQQRGRRNKLAKEKMDQELAFRSKELDLKKQELASKVLQLCRKNEFLKTLDKQVNDLKVELTGKERNEVGKLSRQINRDIEADLDWAQFLKSFESVHPDFNKKLNKIYPGFTAGEIRMSYLLKMNLGTKEIASLLNVTPEGVKKTRQRMRKKMAIDSSINLTEYFMNFEDQPFSGKQSM